MGLTKSCSGVHLAGRNRFRRQIQEINTFLKDSSGEFERCLDTAGGPMLTNGAGGCTLIQPDGVQRLYKWCWKGITPRFMARLFWFTVPATGTHH